jgi:hypothetical protein
MGSTSITLGEVVAPTSPAKTPLPSSTARGGVSTLESATGGETAIHSTTPRGGVAVRASSAKASPTTVGSGDLVREGEAEAPRSPCGSTTGPSSRYLVKTNIYSTSTTSQKIELSRHYLIATGI